MLRGAFIRGCSSGNNVCDVFEKIGGTERRERRRIQRLFLWRGGKNAERVEGRIKDANASPKFSPVVVSPPFCEGV